MTTIACNREMMVSDSKVSVESKGISYPAIKIIKGKDIIVGAAGLGSDCTRFMKWALNDFKGAEPKWVDTTSDDQVIGIILRPQGIFLWGIGDRDDPERIEAEFFAVGSGGKAARVAMIKGADPVEAVELACKVDDLYSGPPLQILYLKDKDIP